MRHNPQPQEMYRHFKGNMYQIRCLAKHSETGEMLVIYQAMYGDFRIYARELSSFMEDVDTDKYPNATQKYRFELLGGDMESPREYEAVKKTEEVNEPEKVSDMADDVETADDAAVSNGKYESQEELNIDPLVLQFLDADSYEKRLEILSMLHSRINNDMINTMAVSVDIEIKEGEIEDRYTELKNCLLTLEKYECNRLR